MQTQTLRKTNARPGGGRIVRDILVTDLFGDRATPALVYVGNRLASTLDLVGPDGRTLRQKYLVGEPQACPAGSAEDMKHRGFVGVYTKQTEIRYYLPGSNRIIRRKI